MFRTLMLLLMPAATAAQMAPSPPSLDAARAAARQVDQATQAPRTGKESMDRVAPLLTVESHSEPGDEAAWRKKKEAASKKALEAPKPE